MHVTVTHTPKSYSYVGREKNLVPLTKYTQGEVIINEAAVCFVLRHILSRNSGSTGASILDIVSKRKYFRFVICFRVHNFVKLDNFLTQINLHK